MTSIDPALERRRVRFALRAFRNDARMSQPEVAEHLDWSPSKVIRIEGGSVGVSVTDLRALLDLYGVTDGTIRSDLEQATRESRRPPWWHRFRDVVTPPFAVFLGLEGAASELSAFDPTLVPGLLQTEAYTRALLSKLPPERTDAIVRLRTERQHRLLRATAAGPRLRFLLDEAALRRAVGGAATMREQLARLKSDAALAHVELSVVPFARGAYPVLREGSIALTFQSGDDVLFVEGPNGALTTRDDQTAVDEFLTRFEASRKEAVSGDEAIAFIDEVLGQYPS
ncbi:helix-turn-helix transcriptional regulator [Streptomyces monashensis]|uniref:helix-turn-helix domain-containing protein n=1 Tax=Streptomyces monashensis TaxID=1678012 RepID=UPI0033DDFCF2